MWADTANMGIGTFANSGERGGAREYPPSQGLAYTSSRKCLSETSDCWLGTVDWYFSDWWLAMARRNEVCWIVKGVDGNGRQIHFIL